MDPFFSEVSDLLVEAAKERGVLLDAVTLEQPVADELLELARTAAHKHERWYAPLTCYLAGVAIGRMESQQGALDPATAASILIGVNAQLNPAP